MRMQGRVGVYIRNGALMVVRRRRVRCPLAPIMLSLLTILLAFAICAHAATYTLYHRLQHLGGPEDPFIARGTLELAGNVVSLESASTVAKDLALWTEKHAESAKDASGALYQIALSADSGSARAISSVKLCHLASATSQSLYLYLSEDDIPYALDYFVSPVPRDGSCPSTPPSKGFLEHFAQVNTTILLRTPSSPPSPELKTPHPLTPEGQIVQPVPEKSFLQKYWIYISIFLVGIMLTSGPDESQQGGGGAN
ncbi:hypothetical protein FA13DRAFT_1361944 [Coprinellus micaceus]|uniref:ER membrane protein complex subunit 10 n=1 Tax=Coprinellus micaceus TaxID=71717 RepID=A0A4Y7TN35_COPMI|nr:hypothetical protein FA13DRAFT_1361944 [Coprinellus micaceus]